MTETMLMMWQILWSTPLYRGLMLVIAAELLLVNALIAWMVVQSARQARRMRARRRFLDALEAPFFEALGAGEPQKLRDWMQRASGYESRFVRDFLCEFLLHTRGEAHDTLVGLYHEFGYAAEEHRHLSGRRADHRLRAMRRLYVVATDQDRQALLAQTGGAYLIHILALQTLARVGQPEDIVQALKATRLHNPMMEEPVTAVLNQLPNEYLAYVFTRWQEFECGRVRRLLLTAAADRRLDGVAGLLASAARSEEEEVRIGACEAAGALHARESLALLFDALQDPSSQVRARAASALGRRREPAAAGPLAEALKDRAFWVRQDAATALGQLGELGLGRLEHVARHCDDRYAAETAAQELQRHSRLLARVS